MRLIDQCSPDASDNLALDAALFHGLEATGAGETLRFWESRRRAVVVGSLGVVNREVHQAACLADNVPIVRRISGGSAVVVGHGCLNYSLVLSLDTRPELRHVSRSYAMILGRILEALVWPGLTVQGMSDLAIEGRKISGSAQRRGRRTLLHHGTFLYAFDVGLIERYLQEPARQPSYRAHRRHTEFVTNAPIAPAAIRAALSAAWGAVPAATRVDDARESAAVVV